MEHLIFRGSKKYPFPNLLDSLANRCISTGTNAYTDSDHTCYTITTGGSEGFLQILPIYFDISFFWNILIKLIIYHILNPVINEETFSTEVHHITGEGEDAGVVYNEMLALENDADELMDQKFREMICPNNGYVYKI